MSKLPSLTLSVVLLLLLAACGGTSEAESDPALASSEPTPIGDGSVTFEEYEARAFALKSCVEEGGHDLIGFKLDAETRFYSYIYLDASLSVHDECYAQEFAEADMLWQHHQREVLGIYDSERAGMIDCLEELGVEYSTDADHGELGGALMQAEGGADCFGRFLAELQ